MKNQHVVWVCLILSLVTCTARAQLVFNDATQQTTAYPGYKASGTAAVVAGGGGNLAGGNYATVSGGNNNTASAAFSTVSGGGPSDTQNPTATYNRATDTYCTVGGGGGNTAGDAAGTNTDASYGTVGGGQDNSATGEHATVAGGYANGAWDSLSTVGGGWDNFAMAEGSVVSGGADNEVASSAGRSVISGGSGNRANAGYSTIGGGSSNQTSATYTTVAGGVQNTATSSYAAVAGGFENDATGLEAFVGGGYNNVASGQGAVVPGGQSNTAGGDWSVAMGRRVKIGTTADGSFAFADSTNQDFDVTVANVWGARFTGGIYFYTNAAETAGVGIAGGGSTWGSVCAREAKENFAPVDGKQVLEKVAAMPIETWNYKAQEDSIRHMGPMAGDFKEAFSLGSFDDRITTVDADGVALAALQGVHKLLKEKDAAIARLEARLADMERRLEGLTKD